MPFEQETLLDHLEAPSDTTVVERFRRFAFIPDEVVNGLSELALSEIWGENNFVLTKYLAVQVPWAIEQEQWTSSDDQFYIRAGHLQTPYGSPIYLVFEENLIENQSPYVLRHAGADIRANNLSGEPEIPEPVPIPDRAQIELKDDHIVANIHHRIPFLGHIPRVAQICAIAGALQWSLGLGLQLRYWYRGWMSYLIPLYLSSRENITASPDAVAAVQVARNRLIVRTILKPHDPYPNARVAVKRHDELPPWMLDAWQNHAAEVAEDEN